MHAHPYHAHHTSHIHMTYLHTFSHIQYKDVMRLMMDKGFPDKEIISQTIASMIGVYENLANALGYTLYLLAVNPSVQDRLRSEIKQFFQNNPVSWECGWKNVTDKHFQGFIWEGICPPPPPPLRNFVLSLWNSTLQN